jgi:hypothetical protein
VKGLLKKAGLVFAVYAGLLALVVLVAFLWQTLFG